MKKLIALVLVCCMLCGYAAYAEETIAERVFLNGAMELLESINLLRDMVRFDVGYSGSDVFSALVKGDGNLLDVSVSANDMRLQAQASETDITVKSEDAILNLQYADVEAWLHSILQGESAELEIYREIVLLLYENIILPDMTVDTEDGLHVSYYAAAEQLMERLAVAADLLAADGRYSAAADQILQMISVAAGGEVTSLSELIEEISRSREQLKTVETDFAVAFELTASADFTRIGLTGAIGDSSDRYAMEWTYGNEGDSFKLDGLLWETRVMGEKTRKYEVTLSAEFKGDLEHHSWSLSFSHPTMGIQLSANGRIEGSMGSVYINFSAPFDRSSRLLLQLDYAVGEDGLIASAYFNPGGMGMHFASLLATEKRLDLSVRTYTGQTVFLLKLLANDDRRLTYGSMEYNQMNNNYQYRATNAITAEFDGEKLVINENNVTITCTGAFESDHEYVITLHAEGENVSPGGEDALIRLGYEGEIGNFSLYCKAYVPNEEEASIFAVFSCLPTEGIPTVLRDEADVIRLTPELLLMMIGQ
ncbi:MAG: hypothetical protein IK099_07820 [Clostridia bacterium]|nr:hypothetical protein [Clostridia bacterium]